MSEEKFDIRKVFRRSNGEGTREAEEAEQRTEEYRYEAETNRVEVQKLTLELSKSLIKIRDEEKLPFNYSDGQNDVFEHATRIIYSGTDKKGTRGVRFESRFSDNKNSLRIIAKINGNGDLTTFQATSGKGYSGESIFGGNKTTDVGDLGSKRVFLEIALSNLRLDVK